MTVAEALALTGVVFAAACFVTGAYTSGLRSWEKSHQIGAVVTITLGALAALLFISAIWTHLLTGG